MCFVFSDACSNYFPTLLNLLIIIFLALLNIYRQIEYIYSSLIFYSCLFLYLLLFLGSTDNVVLNSTGFSLFFIDPNIPEVNSYKSMWVDIYNCASYLYLQVLPPFSRQINEAEVLCTTRRVTIDELAFLDPEIYKV